MTEGERERFRLALEEDAGASQRQGEKGRCFRSTPIRDLSGESTAGPSSGAEKDVNASISRERERLILKTENEGFEVIVIAVDPGVTCWREVSDEIGRIYKTRFSGVPRVHIPRNALPIIERFEKGTQRRMNNYGKSVLDLKPYRELIRIQSQRYGLQASVHGVRG